MSEVVSQIIKGVKQIQDLANAPKELTAMIEKFGVPGEKVLHTAFSRYWNTRKLLDKPNGILLVTTQRFIFVSKMPMIPMMKNGTNELVFSLRSIELVANVKFRRIRAVEITIDKTTYMFVIKHLYKMAKPEWVDDVIKVINKAKAGLT